ncbi:hypothetical protein PFLUV_G00052520 [Perca fluviatilis]|uniref:Uncharacterized protein n=1 Tax=Perca fluviatilis TaxID=8168 RepID=A0A6A5FI68_PERFL|nr:hypothetical protein PFLUV_G00052520 [Perca fluviatilis]
MRESFHRLPLQNSDTLKQWPFVLHVDVETPVETLREMDDLSVTVTVTIFTRTTSCMMSLQPSQKKITSRKVLYREPRDLLRIIWMRETSGGGFLVCKVSAVNILPTLSKMTPRNKLSIMNWSSVQKHPVL